jgi:hypothetical protein
MKLKLFAVLSFLAAVESAQGVELYVSPDGSDENPGTRAAPFQTLEHVREAARATDKSRPGETVVYLCDGVYTLAETLEFDARDSGTETHPVIYRACPDATPVISGGRRLTGWNKTGQLAWEAPTGELDFRQLYVNGKKALRARFPNLGNYLNLVEWDEETRTIVLPEGSVRDWQDFNQAEIHVQMVWSIAIMRLQAFSTADNGVGLTVTNPERDLVFKREHPRKFPNQSFHFENSREFMDQPGEWSIHLEKGICSYLPRSGEDLNAAEVIVPGLETLVSIVGTLDDPVRCLRFEGLTFMYSNWIRPNHQGYLNLQAGQYTIEPTVKNTQYVGRPPAAVYAAGVQNVVFTRNVFKHLGATGLDIHYGSSHCEVVGNVFYDISGTAVSQARLSDPDVQIHTPYNPRDPRDRCVNDSIHNNYIHSVGFDYGGAVGILCGYTTGVTIDHNELRDLAYSGISVGWGWNPAPNAMRDNLIRKNLIDHPMALFTDGAGIYTLSPMPGSVIARNFVKNMEHPEGATSVHKSKCYYLDERSSGITMDNNYWENIGPRVERFFLHKQGEIHFLPYDQSTFYAVRKEAGLRSEFKNIKALAVD